MTSIPKITEQPAETPPETDVFSAGLDALTMVAPKVSLSGGEALIVDLDGFEGPLDLLLVLARAQKVDLRKISILALADQYLDFMAAAKRERLELAADYLVMAAWLTYMKSRLLLPEPPGSSEEPSGEELAQRLAFQLQRLEAMRGAAARLMSRNRLGRDVFQRGAPEGIRVVRKALYEATLFELLKSYGDQRTRDIDIKYEVRKRPIISIEEARSRIERMLGALPDWSRFDWILAEYAGAGSAENEDDRRLARRSLLASSFSGLLELVKEGHAELRQEGQFQPIYLRARRAPDAPAVLADRAGGNE